jgi:hypothetical protein
LFENKQQQRIFEHVELTEALLDKRKRNDRSYSMHWEKTHLREYCHRDGDKYRRAILQDVSQRHRMKSWNGFRSTKETHKQRLLVRKRTIPTNRQTLVGEF